MFEVTKRSKLKRYSERADYSKKRVYEVLDECFMCFISYNPISSDGKVSNTPLCIPQGCIRDGNSLLVHGKNSSALLKYLAEGHEVCVTAARCLGIVYAKSQFDHSVNYKSVVLYASGKEITDEEEKTKCFNIIVNALTYPGRNDHIRPSNETERKGTKLVKLEIKEACAKVRMASTGDVQKIQTWSGVIPLARLQLPAINDETTNKQGIKSISRVLTKNIEADGVVIQEKEDRRAIIAFAIGVLSGVAATGALLLVAGKSYSRNY